MTVEAIVADFDASLFYITLITLKAVYDILTISIISLGLCTSCDIRVDVGNMCDICSQPSTSEEDLDRSRRATQR